MLNLDASAAFVVTPQRDLFAGTLDGADGSTCFEDCAPGEADQWAVFGVADGEPDLIESYPHASDAHAAAAALYSGWTLPTPDWSILSPDMRRTLASYGLAPRGNVYARTFPGGGMIEAHGPGGDDAPTVESWFVHATPHGATSPTFSADKLTPLVGGGGLALALAAAERALGVTRTPARPAPRDALADLSPDLRAYLVDEMGMRVQMMGGGCEGLQHDGPHGSYILVTAVDGCAMPSADDWHVGAYRPGEPDAMLNLTSDHDGKAGVTLRMAVGAACGVLADYAAPATPAGSVLALFEAEGLPLDKVDPADVLAMRGMPVDSTCGDDCARAVRAGGELARLSRQATGERNVAEIARLAADACGVFIDG